MPPLSTEYVWKVALKSYMIVTLTLCHLLTMTAGNPTDPEIIAKGRGGDQISSKVVTDPAAYLRHDFTNGSDPETNPMHEFIADLRTRWECATLCTVMTIVCVSGCLDIILGKELLFHPHC